MTYPVLVEAGSALRARPSTGTVTALELEVLLHMQSHGIQHSGSLQVDRPPLLSMSLRLQPEPAVALRRRTGTVVTAPYPATEIVNPSTGTSTPSIRFKAGASAALVRK